jgi:FKBP-type peptidyl-prolyl cis-trans isomerase (trigger factor)
LFKVSCFDLPKRYFLCKLASMTKTSKYTKPEVKKLENSRIEISTSVSAEFFETFRKKAVQNINDEVEIDGFRKGKVPEAILIAKVGEITILEEMAELAIGNVYPLIVVEEKLDVIGRPEIQITKIATGNPLEFKVTSAVIPDVKLPDYKKIAKETKVEEKIEVTEKDVEDALLNIRKARVDHSGHSHENLSHEEHEKLVDASLPELTDDFAKTLGDFKDVADLKEKVKVMLADDKKDRAREKRRIAISDKLIDASEVDLPEVLVTSELRRIESQFEDDISRMGVKTEDYLKHAKKTIDDLRKDWRPHAEKKAKLQLILNKIASDEKIEVKPEEIETEVKHIVTHYQDADKERAAIYAETILMNDKVYRLLEEIK